MLGLSKLPPNDDKFPPSDERRIVDSIHRGLGIGCERAGGGADTYRVASSRGVVPIDRYNVWGDRKRDAIHPFFNAQFGLVQLMLNHLCPKGFHHAHADAGDARGHPAMLMSNLIEYLPASANASDPRERRRHHVIATHTVTLPPPMAHMKHRERCAPGFVTAGVNVSADC